MLKIIILQRNIRLSIINLAKSLSALPSCASMYVPLTDELQRHSESFSIDWSSQWHKSALQATAIESMTLPSRLQIANRKDLTLIEQSLNAFDSRNIASLALGIACEETLVEDEQSPIMDLSYNVNHPNRSSFHRLEAFRGLIIDRDTTVNKYDATTPR